MNVVYKKGDDYNEQIDSISLSKKYTKYAEDIARYLNFLDEIKDRCEYLHSLADDNGDVAFKLEQAIYYLGVALATCCNYAEAYKDEATKKDELEQIDNTKFSVLS